MSLFQDEISSGNRRCINKLAAPPQRTVQLPGFLQTLDLANPHVAATFHVFGCEPNSTICIVEFVRALAGGPLGTEGWQQSLDLVAGHAITALVGPAAGSVLHTASRYGFSNDIRQFADFVVFFGAANIESLVV